MTKPFILTLLSALLLAGGLPGRMVYNNQSSNDTGTEISGFYPLNGIQVAVWGVWGTTDGSTLEIQLSVDNQYWLGLNELTFSDDALVHVPVAPGTSLRTVLSGVDADTSLNLFVQESNAPLSSLTVLSYEVDSTDYVLRSDGVTPVLRPDGIRQVLRP